MTGISQLKLEGVIGMTKATGLALLALGLVVAVMLCGCEGGDAGSDNFLTGSYRGEDTTLEQGEDEIEATDITGGFEDSMDTSVKGSGFFHFYGNLDGDFVQMTGSYTATGSTLTVSATPPLNTTGKQAGDSITMNLTITSSTTLVGSMTYTRDQTAYTGNISFTRYENQ